ncbi:CBS domain-containing protein [Sphingomicrobium sediminis]|uniref:CBS domain-containing protein n=1 Tax=Sphingomicrobium sediminis TaxID=2950949 RepID=A0A9X2EHN9_9SPHN|nr:CBS domain-containing protein [Sphingomicrobium sediminis]MCM8558210.1 CBS domain-containing protein [Sphingomicrobium sediminis]
MTIAAILDAKGRDVLTILEEATIAEAAQLLGERRIGALVVLDAGGGIAGILSERDIVAHLGIDGGDILGWTVARIMKAPAITVEPEASVDSALALMTEKRIRHLPVTESGALAGIASIGDLVKYQIDHIAEEADAMRAYIQDV